MVANLVAKKPLSSSSGLDFGAESRLGAPALIRRPDLARKVAILAESARYDVSCSSSGSSSDFGASRPGAVLGAPAHSGICHSWAADGRCISLLKILYTNVCEYNCAYCVNRGDNDLPRTTFTVGQLVDLTLNFYRRNYIEGLFLSSAVCRNPDWTMERMVRVAEELRRVHGFGGYIHLKVIPGSAPELIQRAGLALAWDGQELHSVVGVPENVDALLSRRETTFQELWREYVQALAVPERRNPALQRRFMPRRYWKHLVERPG